MVIFVEAAGKMMMMKMMAIKEKRIDETFPASECDAVCCER